MIIRVPNDVEKLATIFKRNKEKLYVVGGFVRNQIIGINDKDNVDIDLCSSCKCEKVIKMLEKTPFETKYLNEEMGVLEIRGAIRMEFATFRREKYAFSGVHIPQNVEFIDSLEEDSLRRDFRCNAIYYDVSEEEIVDPLGGVDDIRKKIIRTTRDPEKVFSEDGERILRMVRIASTLAFNIDEKTYQSAKNNVAKIANISASRKKDEFSQIVLADTDYPYLPDKKNAHARGMMLLSDIGALLYVLPALEDIRKSGLIEDRGKPLFEHIMNVFAFSDPEVRLSALLHDVGKAKSKTEYGNFRAEREFADVIIEKNLGIDGLNFSKKIVERVKNVVYGANFNRLGLESAKNIRRFIVDNDENISLIIKLKNAIALDKSNYQRSSYSAHRLWTIYQKMKREGAPLNVSDLKVKGDQLITAFPKLRVNKTGDLLEALMYKCANHPSLNNEYSLMNLAEKMINKNGSVYREEDL